MSLHVISQQIAELTRRVTIVEGHLEAIRSSLESDRTATSYTTNVTTALAPTHSLPGRDSVRQPNDSETEFSLTETLGVAEASEVANPSANYIYYRIYSDDGAIPSKTPVDPGDPFLGRIIPKYVLPPRNVKAVKRSIANVENIKHREGTSLFLTPYSESPMDDGDMFTIHNDGTGPGSKPQEPLAFVSKMSDFERTALESDGRGGPASTAKQRPDIRHMYYVLYADGYAMPSKVAFDPEEPFLGCIRADYIAPPHSLTSFKLCLSRVERNPTLAYAANLFEDISCETQLKESHISLRTDGPGRRPNEPMAIVLLNPPIRVPEPDGKYFIKNRAGDIYWSAGNLSTGKTVNFNLRTMEGMRKYNFYQWDIKHDTNGNISMTSPFSPSSWVGANLAGSNTGPVAWRLIPADGKFYYLTTDINLDSQNPLVPAARSNDNTVGVAATMATLKEGDQWQMWEFIPV